MKMNTKVLLIVGLMLIALATATIVNVALNFREYAIDEVLKKSETTAEIVKDGLTAHMLSGTMDQRGFFLEKISNLKDVEKLWVVRSESVTNQYGAGLINENPRDQMDREVLKTGKTYQKITENAEHATLRVTVPYIASSYGNPNCLECHTVNEGDVLGAISMEFNIGSLRYTGAITVLKIFSINLLFLIVALIAVNYFIKPYMSFFTKLKDTIENGLNGNFVHDLETCKIKGDGAIVAEKMNTLFTKLEETFYEIKHSLNTFMPRGGVNHSDPIEEARHMIRELSNVYKFKKTIELDRTKEKIYERLGTILYKKFHIEHYALYEVSKSLKERKLIYITDNAKSICSPDATKDASLCRSFRTDTDVISTDFDDLCSSCVRKDVEYVCIPFAINDDLSLVLSITAKTKEDIERINDLSMNIKSYLETAKPAIESKTLMAKLRESSLRDGLTKLYNRRFLEEFIDQTMRQAERSDVTYSVLMIDVDFFKMVNDTYGHDVGDIVIKGLSEVLTTTIRRADLAIRYGGEEFVILLHNTPLEGARIVAENIRNAFAVKKFSVGNGGETLQKTLSVGVSSYPDQADSIWKAIKFADTALYAAKHSGRDKVVVFEKAMFDEEEGSF
jgi:two-component system, cell cycle response regulator